MGRKRAALQRQNGLRVRGDAFSQASAIASTLADPRPDANDVPLPVLPKCAQLLAMLSSDVILAHYIAQGFPNLIHRLLPYGVASCLNTNMTEAQASPDSAPQLPALLLCALLIRCGAPLTDVGSAVEKQVDALVAIAAHADTTVASVALVILRSAVSECEHAVTTAARLLHPESPLWACVKAVESRLALGSELLASAQVSLASLVHLIRLCVGTAGAVVETSTTTHILSWIGTLPLDTRKPSSAQRQALEDATLLLLATIRIEVPALTGAVTNAVSTCGLNAQRAEEGSGEQRPEAGDQCEEDGLLSPRTSHAIAATLYAHACESEGQLAKLHHCVQELRERDFDADKRLASVERLRTLLLDVAHEHGLVYASAVLFYLPGAVWALYGAVCDVEVSTGACACRVLAEMLQPEVTDASLPSSSPWSPDTVPAGFFQNEVAEVVIRLGCVLTLEDALGDYNADVLAASLTLTASLLYHPPQARGAVLSSLCLQRVAELFHTVAEKDDAQAYMSDASHQAVFSEAFHVLRLLTSAELAALSEDIVADVSTVTTFCRDDLTLLAEGLDVLAHLSEAHPYAATLAVDYDFVTEQLQAPDEPQGAEQCLVVGTLNIMTAMAPHVPSTVSLEWIELLLLCVNRLQVWDASSALRLAFWRCLHETLVVSEDSREYIFEDEELVSWMVKVLRDESDARILSEVLHTCLYVPSPIAGLVDAVLNGVVRDHCATGTLMVESTPASAVTTQLVLLDCVALLTCRAEEAHASPEKLFGSLGTIVSCATAWPDFLPRLLGALQDCLIASWAQLVQPVVSYVRDTLHIPDVSAANEVGASNAVEDRRQEMPANEQVAVILLEALGAAATVAISTCSTEKRRACATLATDIIGAAESVPVKASLAALFLLMQSLSAPEAPELAVALLEGSFFAAATSLAMGDRAEDDEHAGVADEMHASVDAQICEALYQTTGRLVQALPYERQQRLEEEAALVAFLIQCALRDVGRSYACGDLVMHVLTSPTVRQHLGQSDPDAYRDALLAMEAQRGQGPLQFVLESYKSELA